MIAQLRVGVAAAGRGAGAAVDPIPARASSYGQRRAAKKNAEPEHWRRAAAEPASRPAQLPAHDAPRASRAVALTAENAVEVWNRGAGHDCRAWSVDQARQFDSRALSAPNRLVIRFKPGYAVCKSRCASGPSRSPDSSRRLAEVTGQPIRVEFALADDGRRASAAAQAAACRPTSGWLKTAEHPLVHRAGELFGAQPVRESRSSQQDSASGMHDRASTRTGVRRHRSARLPFNPR